MAALAKGLREGGCCPLIVCYCEDTMESFLSPQTMRSQFFSIIKLLSFFTNSVAQHK